MLNKNGKAVLKINNEYARTQATVKKIDGNDYICGSNNNQLGAVLKNLKLYVGSGTTGATVDDYCLENEINDLTVISRSGTNDSSGATYENNYIASFTCTYKNNTQSAIVVGEVGILGEDNANNRVMIARDNITPITIAVGKTYTFSMTIG